VLTYDGANAVWSASTITAGAGISVSGSTVSIKNAPFTTGSVLFWDNVNGQIDQDNAALFFDSTNNRLGVGLNSGLIRTFTVSGDASIQANVNTAQQVDIINSSSGTGALAQLRILNNGSNGFAITTFSSGYTTSGINIASTSLINSDLPINIAANNSSTGVRIWSSDGAGTYTEALRFANSETVFNEGGTTRNFRVEGDTDTDLIYVDAAADSVNIGGNASGAKLDVNGTFNASGASTFGDTVTISGDLAVDTNVLFVDVSTNRVGVNNATPTVALDVTGATAISGNLAVDSTTMFVDATANSVGFGTATPDSAFKIDVYGTGDTFAQIKNDGTGTGGAALSLTYGSTAAQTTIARKSTTTTYSSSGAAHSHVFIVDSVSSLTVSKTAITTTVPINATGNITSTAAVTAGNASLSASAVLQADSTTQGFLPPRMTTAQRDAISSPATGLVVFNTTTGVLNFYNGAVWGAV